MAQKDYYKELGVSKSATEKEIKKAYRKLATEFHPDKTKGDKIKEERFKDISEAYGVLGNPEKRKQYDTLGADWEQFRQSGSSYDEFMKMREQRRQYEQQYSQQYSQGDPFGNAGAGGDYSDIFESFFGAGGQRQYSRPGADVAGKVNINLHEAYNGTERTLDVEGKSIKLKIKPGAYSGLQLRAKGKGQKGSRGRAGDLYVTIEVQDHPLFDRRGDDLYMNMEIDLFKALLGGKQEIPTLSGKVQMTLKEGTQNGKTLRLKGKGMPVYGEGGSYGDLFVTLSVKLPEKLTEKQKQMLKDLKETFN